MAVTMYSGFVPVCLQLLGGLKTVLQKAEEHATAQKWDTTVVLNLPALSRHVPARAAGAAGLHSFLRSRPRRRR